MNDRLIAIRSEFDGDLSQSESLEAINQLKIKYLGKKGQVAELYKLLKDMEPDAKKSAGKLINDLNDELESRVGKHEKELQKQDTETKLKEQWLDVTIPASFFPKRQRFVGHMSPIYRIANEIVDTFRSLGFTIADGPQVENDYYNFTSLNIPETHPARDMQDTFWMTNGRLLRTHTSPVQVRTMEKIEPPFRMIAPGRVFRYEATDASHENTFYQVEGLMVDDNISVANLIYFMKILLSEIFRKDVEIRLRPGYFPFVEPGFELDIRCLICGGKGCPVCKQVGWVELLPCGLVHPAVLREGGVNPDRWSGFAFGLGLNRLAMMKYGIDDIRWFESGDLRFASQF